MVKDSSIKLKDCDSYEEVNTSYDELFDIYDEMLREFGKICLRAKQV